MGANRPLSGVFHTNSEPLGIKWNISVTFPEYVRAMKMTHFTCPQDITKNQKYQLVQLLSNINTFSKTSLIVLRFSNSRSPLQILLDINGSHKSNMAAYIPEVVITEHVDYFNGYLSSSGSSNPTAGPSE